MAADFDHVLTRDERRRLDAALQKLAGTATRSELAAPAPTDREEHVWLAQQQVPEAVLKHVVACRLTGDLDLTRLAFAVRDVVRAWPQLNSRFRFGEDGELHKRHAGEDGQFLRLVRAETREQAAGMILDRQGARWDGESDPPFEALVIACRGETVFAVILHRVLDEAAPVEQLFCAVAAAYAGAPVPLVERMPSPARGAGPAVSEDACDAMLPGWMHRCATAEVAVAGYGADSGVPPMSGLARRCSARVTLDLWSGLETDAPDRLILAHLAARFSGYLSALCGRDEIDLRLGAGGLADPPPFLADRSIPVLRVAGSARAGEVIRTILDRLDQPEAALPRERAAKGGRPTLSVSWLGDPSDSLRVGGLSVERLALPTLENRPDLALAVGRDGNGGVAIELVTGQALSPHVGPILLERFVAWLGDGQAALPGVATPQPAGAGHSSAAAAVEAPGTDTMTVLILAEFRAGLNLPELGPDDDFFDHGGHSLIATRIIGRLLSQHGIEIHFNDLFSHPSAAALARKARHAGQVGAESSRSSEGVIEEAPSAPLSLAQASLWKAYAAFGFNEIFNLPFALDFLEPVDEALYGRAFTDVLERHPGLRSLFRREGEGMVQQVVPAAELSQYKWFWTSAESAGVDRRDEAVHHFDLAKELPFRLRFLIDPATGRQVLSFLFHHVVLDEWSVNLMMDEIAYCYRVRAAGGMPVWSDAPAPFHEFARLQDAAGVDQAHLGYWTQMLRGAPQPQPILRRQDRAEPAGEEASAAGGWVEFKLDREATEGLYALAKQSSASLFNVVYAGIAASLGQLGSLPELVVGTSASGRSEAAFFDTVGYFTTVVAHRIRFDETMSLGGLVGQVRNLVNESLPSSEIPIDLVEEALGMTPGRDHLFEVFIQIHAKNKLNGELALPDGRSIAFRQVDPERHESMLGLHFEVMEEADLAGERSIRVLMSYRSEHYGPQEVEKITATTSAVFALMGRAGGAQVTLAELGAHLVEG